MMYVVFVVTVELWVYIGTPLPNPSGNTGVMVCVFMMFGWMFVTLSRLNGRTNLDFIWH